MRMDKDDKMLFAFAVETGIVVGVSVVTGICVGVMVTGMSVVTCIGVGVGTNVGDGDGGSDKVNDDAKTTCTCIT